MNVLKWKDVVDNFSPAWFAAVMGTGGLANVLVMLSSKVPILLFGARVLLGLNILLFIVLIIPWTARWIRSRDRAIADLKHPLMSNFYSTMPAAAIILGTNLLMIGRAYFSDEVLLFAGITLWIIGTCLAFVFAIAGMYNLFKAETISPESVNLAWLMTPVVNIVVPLLGNLLIEEMAGSNPAMIQLIHLIDTMFYGIGFMLFLILSSFIISRLIQHKLPPAMMAPSFWILLGPIGVGTLALMGLADTSANLGLIDNGALLKYLATILWGFGFWAFFLVLMVMGKYLRSGGIPFSLSWWAFTFPLAAYTMSSLAVAQWWESRVVFVFGALLAILLVVLWILTLIRTISGVFKGSLLVPPQQADR